jgi:hypothetical protein
VAQFNLMTNAACGTRGFRPSLDFCRSIQFAVLSSTPLQTCVALYVVNCTLQSLAASLHLPKQTDVPPFCTDYSTALC